MKKWMVMMNEKLSLIGITNSELEGVLESAILKTKKMKQPLFTTKRNETAIVTYDGLLVLAAEPPIP